VVKRLPLFLVTFALVSLVGSIARTQAPPAGDDPYLWLEDLEGARALEWVKTENARTLAVLQKDPRFDRL
jgi:prolyl oligopeptidase